MSEIARVALDIETALVYGRRVLEGIASYLRANHPWSICLEHHELGQHLGALLKRWNGDGIITRFATKESVALLKKRRIAAIDVGDIEPFLGILKIQSADLLIGRIAAEHLVERGFRSLACCGFTDEHWSQRRRDGFTDEVKRHNLSVSHFEAPRVGQETWKRDQQHLADWITQLPKPLGVFATNDFRAQHVLDACSRLDLAVPETVAVVGVDNDEVVCGFCQPSLTSIIPDAERIGFEAATWLDRIMQGEAPPSSVIEVPPRGIAIRQSSDAYAVSDPLVAAALRYIREHACKGISVSQVIAHVGVSRSWLERSFRKFVEHSPQSEIRAVQVRRCKELLKSTALPLDRIAFLAGFEHPEYMSVVFKRETGLTPGRFRKESLAKAGDSK